MISAVRVREGLKSAAIVTVTGLTILTILSFGLAVAMILAFPEDATEWLASDPD
jgi:hypothetical protein